MPPERDTDDLDRAGKLAAYVTNEWSDDPAIMQTQALCYVGIQLERIADALEEGGQRPERAEDE